MAAAVKMCAMQILWLRLTNPGMLVRGHQLIDPFLASRGTCEWRRSKTDGDGFGEGLTRPADALRGTPTPPRGVVAPAWDAHARSRQVTRGNFRTRRCVAWY